MEERKRVTVYLVRHYCRTTDQHPYGPGLESFTYTGKRGHVVGSRGSYIEAHPYEDPHDPAPYELEWYGYKRCGDAKRAAEDQKAWTSRHPTDAFADHMFTVVAEGYWA